MYIHGLIPRNFAELAEAVPIVFDLDSSYVFTLITRELPSSMKLFDF